MKITAATTYVVEGIKYNWTLIKVETDAGIHGWGEGTNWPGAPLISAACQHVGERVVGLDPRRIDFIWTKLYRDMHWMGQAGVLLSAISAIDIALWDIKGKLLGAPVYELLGGAYRTAIPLYANYWFIEGGHDPDDYGRQARETVARGFEALKLDPFAHVNYLYGQDLSTSNSLTEAQKQRALDVVRAVAEAVGPGVPIAIETHAFLNGPTAVEMARRIHDLGINCMWYEEPALPEYPGAIADIRRQIPLPVCVGERIHTRTMARALLEREATDYLMPDVVRCGGISELRKIANLAETYNVPIAPHNPNGPICTLASAHVAATIPNLFRQEFMAKDVPWCSGCLSHPLAIEDGHLLLSDRPGLGVELDEEVLAQHPGLKVTPADRTYYI